MPFRTLLSDALIHGEIWQEYNTLSMSIPGLREQLQHLPGKSRQVSVLKAARAAANGTLPLPSGPSGVASSTLCVAWIQQPFSRRLAARPRQEDWINADTDLHVKLWGAR
jgi:hypothetical protein